MRAVVLDRPDADPRIGEFPEPPEDSSPARVLAAPVNPIDHVIARNQIVFRHPVPPAVMGLEGVAELPDGSMRYFFFPELPYGSYAEQVPLAGAESAPLPAGLDAVHAAALGVPGMAAWLALTRSAQLHAGETVLILGATGAAGRIAVQAARALGAGSVFGTARSAGGLDLVERLGGVALSVAEPDRLDALFGAASPHGFDVVIDLLWGAPLAAAALHLAHGARVVQVGNSAGAKSTIDAPSFRNTGSVLMGHSNFLVSPQERMTAYAHIADLAARGELEVTADPIRLDDFDVAWRGRGPAKPVIVFPPRAARPEGSSR